MRFFSRVRQVFWLYTCTREGIHLVLLWIVGHYDAQEMSTNDTIFEGESVEAAVGSLKIVDDSAPEPSNQDDGSDSDSESSSEDDEDLRILRLQRYARSHTAAETAGMARSDEYCRASLVINGVMCMNKQATAAHLLVSAVLAPAEFETRPMASQVFEKKEAFKEFAGGDTEMCCPLLGALEMDMLLVEEKHPGKDQVQNVLIHMFNADVFGEDEEAAQSVLQEWKENTNISRAFGLDAKQAARVRELAEPFFAWLE